MALTLARRRGAGCSSLSPKMQRRACGSSDRRGWTPRLRSVRMRARPCRGGRGGRRVCRRGHGRGDLRRHRRGKAGECPSRGRIACRGGHFGEVFACVEVLDHRAHGIDVALREGDLAGLCLVSTRKRALNGFGGCTPPGAKLSACLANSGDLMMTAS